MGLTRARDWHTIVGTGVVPRGSQRPHSGIRLWGLGLSSPGLTDATMAYYCGDWGSTPGLTMTHQMAHMRCETLVTISIWPMCECHSSGTTNSNSWWQPPAAECLKQNMCLCFDVRLLHGAIRSMCQCQLSLPIAQTGTAKHHEDPSTAPEGNQKGTTGALEGLNQLVAQGCYHICGNQLVPGARHNKDQRSRSHAHCGLPEGIVLIRIVD